MQASAPTPSPSRDSLKLLGERYLAALDILAPGSTEAHARDSLSVVESLFDLEERLGADLVGGQDAARLAHFLMDLDAGEAAGGAAR